MRTVRIVLATHNQGKVPEMEAILGQTLGPAAAALSLVTAGELHLPDPRETGTTFEENALLKARFVAERTGLPSIADDSGLIVDILGRAPGILSARWAGRHGDSAANNALLLAQLEDIPDPKRTARFECCAALVIPASASARGGVDVAEGRNVADSGPVEVTEHGEMRGTLLRAPRGTNGFGYDPLFVPDDQPGLRPGQRPRTSAEMSEEEKDSISHRGKAVRALAKDVRRLLFA